MMDPSESRHRRGPRCGGCLSSRDPRLGKTQPWWTVQGAFLFLTVINLINYVDRGIVPGAAAEFSDFVRSSLQTSSPDIFVGLLQSAFIVGFSLAALVFGHAIHYFPPFKMMGIGLCVWVVATVLCGAARDTGSYAFLFVARMLSGVGEASFQCICPPFIMDLGGDSAGRWLGVFYLAIPVGTALGYPWGALFASSSLTWSWAFYAESLLMLPGTIMCFFLPFTWRPERAPIEEDDDAMVDEEAEEKEGAGKLVNVAATVAARHEEADARVQAEARHITVAEEFCAIVRRPIYILNSLGYAANTGMMIGVSTFGSKLLLEYGFFSTESASSSVFGIVLCLAGAIGTPLGGILVDCKHSHSEEAKLAYILGQNTVFVALGCFLSCLSCYMHERGWFLLFFALGATLLFAATAGINLVTMLSVAPPNRSFAIALCTLAIHALGDVPSPIVVGALLDTLAPACSAEMATADDGSTVVSPECTAQLPRVRLTLFLTCLWLSITVLCFGVGYTMARRHYRKLHAGHPHLLLEEEEEGGGGMGKPRGQSSSLTRPLVRPTKQTSS